MADEKIPTGEEYEKEKQIMKELGEKLDCIHLQKYYLKYLRLFEKNQANRNCQMLYAYATNWYAYALSNQEDLSSLESALYHYTDLSMHMPQTEQFKENADIVESKIKAYYQELGKNLDYEELRPRYEIAVNAAEDMPDMPVYKRLRDWIESQYAFALCRQDDIEMKKKALMYFKDLAKRYPNEEIHAKNRDITEQQIKQMKKAKRRFF